MSCELLQLVGILALKATWEIPLEGFPPDAAGPPGEGGAPPAVDPAAPG